MSAYQLSDQQLDSLLDGAEEPAPTVTSLSDNDLDLLLGLTGTAAAGAGGIALEINRRRQSNPNNPTVRQAWQEFTEDLGTAGRVLRGSTPQDESEKRIALGLDDPTAGTAYRSIKEYGEMRDPSEGSFYDINPREGYVKNPITQAAIAMRDAYNPSAEDFLSLKRQYRQERGMSAEGPRSDTVLSRIPMYDGIRDVLPSNLGGFNEEEKAFRAKQGLAVMKGNSAQTAGSLIGRAGSDFVNNGARGLWWLINAPQAVVDLASEYGAGLANREGLYGQELATYEEAVQRGWVDPSTGDPLNNSINRAISDSQDVYYNKRYQDKLNKAKELSSTVGDADMRRRMNQIYSRRRTGNNLSTLMALPAAIGINAGIGLNTPFGGSDGRKAIFPTDEDPTKTSNVLAEVAAKYILGRQGDLLPWDEFKKVRPDVSESEYKAYKAHRWNKNVDLNPFDDGKAIAPLGIAKWNSDGINGAELQFLGKDMPVGTALAPTGMAILGGMAGAALGRYGAFNELGVQDAIDRRKTVMDSIEQKTNLTDSDYKRLESLEREIEDREARMKYVQKVPKAIKTRSAVRNGLIGGFAGLVGTSMFGNEMERRRRSENEAALNARQAQMDNGGF